MKGKVNYLKLLAVVLNTMLFTSCAANMAANGQQGPDLDVVVQETSRLEVERHLGSPLSIRRLSNGHKVVVYEVEPNIDPNMGRAAVHGTLDLFTFGLWEVIGGPGEAYIGRRIEVTAEYDEQDRLIRLDSQKKAVF